MSEALGNQIDHAIVSQATRDMARNRAAFPSLEDEVRAAEDEWEQKQARKRQIEAKLSMLSGRVQSAGYLPQAEYRSLCREQADLKTELGNVATDAAQLKLKLTKLQMRLADQRKTKNAKLHNEPMSPILRDILTELREIKAMLKKEAP